MNRSVLRATMFAMIACTGLLLAGCDKVKGTYSDPAGALTIDFKGGGKANMSMPLAGTKEVTYDVSGDKVTVHGPAGVGDIVFTINSDGSLSGGSFATLKKKD